MKKNIIEEYIKRSEEEFLRKMETVTTFENFFNFIYIPFSEDLLKITNKVTLEKDVSREYKIGFQNATLASLNILLEIKKRFENDNIRR